jgi:phosphoribosylformylglycinamidine synthase
LKVAVVQFPGSNCDRDTLRVLSSIPGVNARLIWHNEFGDDSFDAAILPGGFSFGDHLRAGAIAAHSNAMQTIRQMADDGKPILGICNGFQILIEAGLLPGALLRNALLKFVCKWANLQVETTETAFTCSFKQNAKVRMPIAHNEGRFFADNDSLVTLRKAKQIVLRYSDENPTGTIDNIVAVSNADANVVGMMPHPERASSPSLGGSDGLKVFQSMMEWAQ